MAVTAVDTPTGVERLTRQLLALPSDRVQAVWERIAPGLNPATRRLLERIVAEAMAKGWRSSPLAMAQHFDPDVKAWPHARLLSDQMRKAVLGESRFQCWNLPTQTGKSFWLRWGLQWALDMRADRTWQYLAYGDRLATETADFLLTTTRAHADEFAFTLKPDRQTHNLFRTEQGGGMLCVSLHGSVSGFSASGGVLVDDPLKNWQDAHSLTKRDVVWDEIRAVAMKRLSEGACFILAHTRLHTDDPTGRMRELAREMGVDVEMVVLPMLAGDNDRLGRAPGEPLAPERFSLAECQLRAKLDGPYLSAAMEAQDPLPEEGGEIKREWWQWTVAAPARFDEAWTSWDLRGKDRATATSDYVVGVVGGRVGRRVWIVDMLRGQYSQFESKCAIALMAVRHPYVKGHVIEAAGLAPEVMADLRQPDLTAAVDDRTAGMLGMTATERDRVTGVLREGLGRLYANTARYSKLVRARANAGLIQAGDVTLLERADGRPEAYAAAIVDEHAAFPPRPGGHDDIVDAVSQLLSRLRVHGAAFAASTGRQVAAPQPGASALRQPVAR